MQRKVFEWNGKKYFLLGRGTDRENYYLEEAHWDCGWYWGLGYVETFTNRRCPHLSRDISSHQHFDGLFFNGCRRKNGFDAFKDFFEETPFERDEIWKILELMKSAYIARTYADMLHIQGAHYTTNPAYECLANDEEYNRINQIVIPSLMKELYKILEGKED